MQSQHNQFVLRRAKFFLLVSGLVFISYSIFTAILPFVDLAENRLLPIYSTYVFLSLVASVAAVYTFWQLKNKTGLVNILPIAAIFLQVITLVSFQFHDIDIHESLLMSFFLFFFLALFAFLQFKFISFVESRIASYQYETLNYKVDNVVSVKKQEIIAHDSQVVSGSGVFDLLTEPLHYGACYREVGQIVPAGSRLLAGKVELAILSLNESFVFNNFKKLIQKKTFILDQKKSFLILLVLICLLIDFSLNIYRPVAVLTLSLILSLFPIFKYVYSLISEELINHGIYYSNLDDLKNRPQLQMQYQASGDVFTVRKFEILNDSLSPEKTALMLFYITSFGEEIVWKVIREFLAENHINSYLKNPLENIVADEQGFFASLEGLQLMFGTESFLLENAVILNATDVINKNRETAGFYLAINKEIVAAMEVCKLGEESLKLHGATSSKILPVYFNMPSEELTALDAPFLVFNHIHPQKIKIPFTLVRQASNTVTICALLLLVVLVLLYCCINNSFYALQLVVFTAITGIVLIFRLCRDTLA